MYYSNPERADDPHAHHPRDYDLEETAAEVVGEAWVYERGWYWWSCFPGCMPDGEPDGPYDSETAALEAAREAYAE